MTHLYAAIFLLGFLGILGQSAYIREIIAVFNAPELLIGTVLASWLVGTAIGSGLVARLFHDESRGSRRFFLLLPLYGTVVYAGIAAIPAMPVLLGSVPGERIPLDLQMMTAVVAILPGSIAGGLLFTLAIQAVNSRLTHTHAGKVYLLDSAGSAAAGVLFSLVFIRMAGNETIALLIPVTACIAAAAYAAKTRSPVIGTLIITALALVIVLHGWYRDGRERLYAGQTIVAQADTQYGRLTVTEHVGQTTVYSDADVLFGYPDEEAAEYVVHVPLLAAESIKRVLIIGGGPSGIIDEALRYPGLERLTCVELDPDVFDITGPYLPGTWRTDPRVNIVFDDGRSYLGKTADVFDVVILNTAPPVSGTANRYYTTDFFRMAAGHLSKRGIFACSLPGSDNYLTDEKLALVKSIRISLKTAFPTVRTLPGLQVRLLASAGGGIDSLSWRTLAERRLETGIEMHYVRDYFLQFNYSDERVADMERALDEYGPATPNTDSRPVAAVYGMMADGSAYGSRMRNVLSAMIPRYRPWMLMIGIGALVAGYAALPGAHRGKRVLRSGVLACGFTELTIELTAILGFQAFFGLLYGRIALLVGIYMSGLAIGAAAGSWMADRGKPAGPALAVIQSSIAGVCILWIVVVTFHETLPGARYTLEALFYLLTGISGIFGGAQFPIADACYRRIQRNRRSGRGAIYALDCAGSACGALLAGPLLIPLLGIHAVLAVLAAVNAFVAIRLLRIGEPGII